MVLRARNVTDSETMIAHHVVMVVVAVVANVAL